MQVIEYRDHEIRPETILLVGDHTLMVTDVVFRAGRGLELFTRYADGNAGPVLYPHPDETLSVLRMPPMSDDDAAYLRATTSDYPWAAVRGH